VSFSSNFQTKTLAELTSVPDYFSKVSAVIERLQHVESRARCHEILVEATRLLGADVSAFASFIRDDESMESYRFMLACDPHLCFTYEKSASLVNDPWILYARGHSEPIRGSELTGLTPAQRDVTQIAESFGFRSIVIIPAPSIGGVSRIGGVCFGSNQPGFFECAAFSSFKIMARSFVMEFHEWWLRKLKTALICKADITPGDIQLLRLQNEGHATKEIARLLDTTVRSVDSRFFRLNAKLGMPSRKASAKRAQEYGLI
jgi:DNA-binding CsgD family transcriptional regulator